MVAIVVVEEEVDNVEIVDVDVSVVVVTVDVTDVVDVVEHAVVLVVVVGQRSVDVVTVNIEHPSSDFKYSLEF